jgi:hypothetical protein
MLYEYLYAKYYQKHKFIKQDGGSCHLENRKSAITSMHSENFDILSLNAKQQPPCKLGYEEIKKLKLAAAAIA